MLKVAVYPCILRLLLLPYKIAGIQNRVIVVFFPLRQTLTILDALVKTSQLSPMLCELELVMEVSREPMTLDYLGSICECRLLLLFDDLFGTHFFGLVLLDYVRLLWTVLSIEYHILAI